MIEAVQQAAPAYYTQSTLTNSHFQQQALLHGLVLGSTTPSALSQAAAWFCEDAARGSANLTQFESLPTAEVVKLVR
ncbi:MAG: hypothetical protein ACTH30_03565 [Leucobacter sp.]